MIYSMTGFGKTTLELRNTDFLIEIKTLNSKQSDVYMRLPSLLQEMEMEIRNVVSKALIRGKINVQVSKTNTEELSKYSINTNLVNEYYNQLKEINLPKDNVLQALLSLPNVVISKQENLTKQEQSNFLEAVKLACDDVKHFREKEGVSLLEDLAFRIKNIKDNKEAIVQKAPDRIDKLRKKIDESLKSIGSDMSYNEDRFEQELIYYIEKLDVTEEFVRLDAHCAYFMEVLNSAELSKGKKLNFIAQEIGREINTLGSKANDALIQKHVVQMKDELEKIKEQVNNVL